MCWHWNVSHVLYIHSCVLYIHPCAVHRAVFCPSHLTLSLHMPSSMKCFPSDCKTSWVVLLRVWLLVSTLEEESTKRKETKQWRVLVDWIPLQDAFFFFKELHEQNKFSGRERVKHAVYLMCSKHTVTSFHTQIKNVLLQKVKATV